MNTTVTGQRVGKDGLSWKWFLVIFRRYGCGIRPFHFTSAAPPPLLRYLEIQGDRGVLQGRFWRDICVCTLAWSLRKSKGVSVSALSFLGGVKCLRFWGGKIQWTSIGGADIKWNSPLSLIRQCANLLTHLHLVRWHSPWNKISLKIQGALVRRFWYGSFSFASLAVA